jgi:uncharacterized protein YndB with AHSA1/START domain
MSENLSLQLSKIVNAPRSRAFEAWTRPEELLCWFAPGAMKATTIDLNLTVGGTFRWAMQGPSPRTGENMQVIFTGIFQEIVPDQLLKFSWQSEGDVEDSTIVTVVFADVDGGTEIALTHERIRSIELYNRNKMGWSSMLDKLQGLIDRSYANAS